jgi:hypothetical protein
MTEGDMRLLEGNFLLVAGWIFRLFGLTELEPVAFG